MNAITIVSHPLCPHAQRLVLLAKLAGRQRGTDFEVRYLPYATLRDEAPCYSETGDLPVLQLDGVAVSTSSADSAEYLAQRWSVARPDATPEAELADRHAVRAVDTVLDRMRGVFTARDAASLDTGLAALFGALARVERRLPAAHDREAGPSRAELALTPLASLLRPFPALRDDPRWQDLPRVAALIDAASADARVRDAECPDYAAEFDAFFRMTGSAFPTLLAATAPARVSS